MTRGGNRRRARLGARTSRPSSTSTSPRRCSARRRRSPSAPRACETCAGTGARARHDPRHLLDVQRHRRAAPGPPVTARPDGDLEPVPALRRAQARRSPPPAPTAGARGGAWRSAPTRRGAGGRRRRLHPAPLPGEAQPAPGRAARRPLPPLEGAAPPEPHPGRLRPAHDRAGDAWPRPPSGRSSRWRPSTGRRKWSSPPGCPSGHEVRLRGRGVPHLQRRGPGRPARHRRRRDPDGAHAGPGGALAAVRRRAWRGRSAPRSWAHLAHSQRLQVRPGEERECAGWWRTFSLTTRPARC